MLSHLVPSVSATVSISLDREESNNSLCTIECLERLATLFSSMPPWVTHENSVTDRHCSADSEIDIDRVGARFYTTGPNLLLLRGAHHVRTG